MKELTSRQAGIMLFITNCAMKLLVLPSLIINTAKNSLWLVFLLMFLIDGVFVCLILALINKQQDMSLKEFFEKTLGKVLSKIVIFCLGLLCLFKVSMLIRECFEFYSETSYVDFQWFQFIVPVILFVCYASIKSYRSLGRASEIFIYFVVLTLIMSVLFSFGKADLTYFMPLLSKGITPVLKACLDYSFWFGDFILLYFYMGNIQIKKNSTKQIFFYWLTSSLIVLLIASLHYGLFGSFSSMYKTSIVDVTEYIPRLDTTGRFTWVVIFLWPIATIFAMSVYSNFAAKAFQMCFNINHYNKRFVVYCALSVSFAILIMTIFSEVIFINFITTYLKYFVLIIQYLVSLLVPIYLIKLQVKEKTLYAKKLT